MFAASQVEDSAFLSHLMGRPRCSGSVPLSASGIYTCRQRGTMPLERRVSSKCRHGLSQTYSCKYESSERATADASTLQPLSAPATTRRAGSWYRCKRRTSRALSHNGTMKPRLRDELRRTLNLRPTRQLTCSDTLCQVPQRDTDTVS